MELTVTLNYGPLEAEFTGDEREEVEDNLLRFIEFLEENGEAFEGIEYSGDGSTDRKEPGLDPEYWEGQQGTDEEPEDTDVSESAISYGSISDRTNIPEETLLRYFDIDPSGEEPPYLNFDVEVLGESGSSRSEKQMRGSLILLTLWRECYGAEEVRSPELKDALRISGIDDENLSNMYQFNNGEGDRYFRREGSGANTDISLTLPGQREGFDQIEETTERLETEDDE